MGILSRNDMGAPCYSSENIAVAGIGWLSIAGIKENVRRICYNGHLPNKTGVIAMYFFGLALWFAALVVWSVFCPFEMRGLHYKGLLCLFLAFIAGILVGIDAY